MIHLRWIGDDDGKQIPKNLSKLEQRHVDRLHNISLRTVDRIRVTIFIFLYTKLLLSMNFRDKPEWYISACTKKLFIEEVCMYLRTANN